MAKNTGSPVRTGIFRVLPGPDRKPGINNFKDRRPDLNPPVRSGSVHSGPVQVQIQVWTDLCTPLGVKQCVILVQKKKKIAAAVFFFAAEKKRPDNLFGVYFYRKVFLFRLDSEDSFRVRSSSICLDLRLDLPIIFIHYI